MQNYTVLDHPVIYDKMTKLRNEETGTKEFRELTTEIASIICYEALHDAPIEYNGWVTTPVERYPSKILQEKYCIVPIYRAGLGMEDGVHRILPNAKTGHIGIYRDPETLQPHTYYEKFPIDIADRTVLLLDPMLATGGTATAAVTILKERGVKKIKFLCILSATPGIQKMFTIHPDVQIFSASHDDELNDHGYIVPGLGDAGDRIFGTK